MMADKFKSKKILVAHSNVGAIMSDWHERMRMSAVKLGYNMSSFGMGDLYPYVIFPQLDKLWRKRDIRLLKFYEALGNAIADCDVFIHFNGVHIHPEFLQQFNKLKIFHCADDPDASKVISRPVAREYDICAIANPACLDMYKRWGCNKTFFWPLGSYSYREGDASVTATRDIPLVFTGSRFGI